MPGAWRNSTRLIAEQERVAEEIRPGASIKEAKEILNSDPGRQLKGTDALQGLDAGTVR